MDKDSTVIVVNKLPSFFGPQCTSKLEGKCSANIRLRHIDNYWADKVV